MCVYMYIYIYMKQAATSSTLHVDAAHRHWTVHPKLWG